MRHCLALLGQRALGRLCLSEGLILRLVFAYLKVFTVLWGMAKKKSRQSRQQVNYGHRCVAASGRLRVVERVSCRCLYYG